jgi:hypothetical protein
MLNGLSIFAALVTPCFATAMKTMDDSGYGTSTNAATPAALPQPSSPA